MEDSLNSISHTEGRELRNNLAQIQENQKRLLKENQNKELAKLHQEQSRKSAALELAQMKERMTLEYTISISMQRIA